jgi:biogenesis of lysosome-related organelles complex 1 subunit 2
MSENSTNLEATTKLVASSPSLETLANEMITNTSNYIKYEVETCINDYKTLEKMNTQVTERYLNYTDLAKSVSNEMIELNHCYNNLYPLLAQVSDIEKCVGDLEQAATRLDAYSKKLEAKYKQFSDKRT